MSRHEEDEFEIVENPDYVRVMPEYTSNGIWHSMACTWIRKNFRCQMI